MSAQNYATAATSYKKLDLSEKNTSKRRGRACTRKEKRNTSYETRIIRDRLAVSSALREYNREKHAAEKDNVESFALTELKSHVKMCEGNLKMAHISQEAMSKFPPLHV